MKHLTSLLFFIGMLSLTLAANCYTGECIEFTNCTVQDQALVNLQGNLTPALGAVEQYRVFNTSWTSDYLNAIDTDSGFGIYNATFNLSRGNYFFQFNGTYDGLNSTGALIPQAVVPACPFYKMEVNGSMDIQLWGLFFVVGLALIIVGASQRSKFLTVMGGFISIIMGVLLIVNGVSVNYLTQNDVWTMQLGLITVGIGIVGAYYGATQPSSGSQV